MHGAENRRASSKGVRVGVAGCAHGRMRRAAAGSHGGPEPARVAGCAHGRMRRAAAGSHGGREPARVAGCAQGGTIRCGGDGDGLCAVLSANEQLLSRCPAFASRSGSAGCAACADGAKPRTFRGHSSRVSIGRTRRAYTRNPLAGSSKHISFTLAQASDIAFVQQTKQSEIPTLTLGPCSPRRTSPRTRDRTRSPGRRRCPAATSCAADSAAASR